MRQSDTIARRSSLHLRLDEHPQATSRYLQPAWCGRWVDPAAMADTVEACTCAACARELAANERALDLELR